MIMNYKDNASTGVLQDLAMFSEKEDAKIGDEIEVIKPRSFLRKIVKQLNLLSY